MMINQLKKNLQKRRSNGSISLPLLIVLVLAAVAAGIMLPHTFQTSTPGLPSSAKCPVVPDTSKPLAKHPGYYLLQADVPIVYGEIADAERPHMELVSPQGVSPKEYKVYIKPDTGLPQSVSWIVNDQNDPNIQKLLFVERPGENANDPFYVYFDIYLLGTSVNDVPQFIQEFCNRNLPLGPITVGTTVPTSFRAGDIQWSSGTIPPADTMYYVFSYESQGSFSFDRITSVQGTVGTLTVGGRTYQAHYIWQSVIQYIGLIDTQNPTIAYKYTTTAHAALNMTPTPSVQRQNLQLQTFSFPKINAWAWWQPECKPAVYLYPTIQTKVHVAVSPKGILSYTKPTYPLGGWDVIANPGGGIQSGFTTYPYLYYEAKIQDDAIQKPDTGYVVTYDHLDSLYARVLPQLGLNPQETKDFIAYWHGILPKSSYYFVGVMSEPSIDAIEPLTISPKPDTIVRIRLYFQPLSSHREVKAPEIKPIVRNGFTVVEWGGLVKRDAGHPFTCSQ
jgi:hypothetical protein